MDQIEVLKRSIDTLNRADIQIEKAFDSMDSVHPDHDLIKERISGAASAALVARTKAHIIAQIGKANYIKRVVAKQLGADKK